MDKCLCGHSLHTEPCEVCGCERVKTDDATQLDYALTRLRLCIVENDALAQYPPALLRDDIRLALVELARLSVENARLSLDRRAAWANGQTLKEECDRAQEQLVELHRVARTVCVNSSKPLGYTDEVVLVPRKQLHRLYALLGEGAGDAGVGE